MMVFEGHDLTVRAEGRMLLSLPHIQFASGSLYALI